MKVVDRRKYPDLSPWFDFIFLEPGENFEYGVFQGHYLEIGTYNIVETCFDKALGKRTDIGLHKIDNDKIPAIINELQKRKSELEHLKCWHELKVYFEEHYLAHAESGLYSTYRNLRRNPKKLIFRINLFISKVIELLETNYRAGKTFWLSGL